MRQVKWVAISVVAAAGVAWGQPAQKGNPLSGPAVTERAGGPTLVEKDFSGRLKRPEIPPEEAAYVLVKPGAESKAKADAILAERAEILDKIVVENLDVIVKFANARQAGDRRDQILLLSQLMGKLQPLNARGNLGTELRGTLDEAKAKQYDTILAEYRKAAADEANREAKARGERLTPRQIETRENLQSLGAEIKRSYERQITAKVTEFDRIIGQLGLEPEQETNIRNLVTEFGQQTKGKATPEQRRDLFFRIMARLNPDQQRKLMSLYLGHPDPGM